MAFFPKLLNWFGGNPTGFDGAQRQRRLASWQATEENINSLLMQGGDVLRARARQVVRSNPYASNAADSFIANVVGAGIKPSSLIEDPALKDQLQQLWLTWTDEADADGLTDFYGLQALAARALFEAGECFVRFRPRRPSDGLSVPLQLQLLEAEHLPFSKTGTAPNGNAIRCGIEFDSIGRRVAYHFYRKHPGDGTDQREPVEQLVRVPASEVLHLYRPQRPGQIRGVPWVAPALVKLYLLDQYDDAELDRKKVAALFAGFITKTAPEDALLGETADGLGGALAGLSPGTMQVLLPGEDIKFSSPADVGGSYEMFQYRTLLAISAALGVPYTNVTGDLKAANYSSIRAGTVEFRRRLEQFQHATLVFQLCRPVWSHWLQTAKLAGKLPNSTSPAVKWIPPKWEWVDPLKDRQAEKIAQECGWKAPSDIIESEGYDVDETFRRIAADRARAQELGLKMSLDEPQPMPDDSKDEGSP